MKQWLIILSLGFSLLRAQDNVKQGLLVVHVESASKTEFKQKIYNYHFLNGHFTGREELMVVPGKQNGKDYVRTDLGENIIYDNRYVITSIGNIIDVKERKILWDGRANLVDVRNDSAIYYTNDAFKGKFYSVYNFKTKTYSEVKQLTFKAKIGQDVEYDKTKQPFQIFLYPQGKPKVELVKDAGYGQKITTDSKVPDPLLWWIDDNNFVYTNFTNKENTEIKFIKVAVDTKQTTVLGGITIIPQNVPASFKKLSKTQGLYQFGTKQILIDVATNTISDLQFTKPSDGFSAECKASGSGRIVKLNDKDIGKYHFQLKNFKTNGNMVGLVKELVVGTESYQQGIAVWNYSKKTWENVDAEDVLAFIGWIRE
jgi:hypothetical protein